MVVENPTAPPIEHGEHRLMAANQVAWVVLLTSFAVFCTICAGTSFGVNYFLFGSSVAMSSQVHVARGTVGLVSTDLSESFERTARTLARGDTVLTDPQSQATVMFRDVTLDNRLVAAVTLRSDSELVLRGATQPRFEWGNLGYQVSLERVTGGLDVFIPDDALRETVISVQLPDGTTVDIRNGGHFSVEVSEELLRLETRDGQAAILPPNRENSRPVVDGQVGIYSFADQTIEVGPGTTDLLVNSFFDHRPIESFGGGQPSLPEMETWNCGERANNEPLGQFNATMFDARRVIHFLRGNGATTHGETECFQPFGPIGQVGLNVRDYDQLEIHSTFYIADHSLDLCGIDGTECPLMLRMDYIDYAGQSNRWFHGFYAKETSVDFPQTCPECPQEHERVNPGVWYTYESGNLLTTLLDKRPASILNVRFYASGHEYDVYVSELSLLASNSGNSLTPETVSTEN